jgi:hypothetical protein
MSLLSPSNFSHFNFYKLLNSNISFALCTHWRYMNLY